MNIIFLDIDGVLNSVQSMVAFSKVSSQFKGDKLDPVCVGLLQRLIEETASKVVISSSWRIGRDVEYFQNMFSKIGAPVLGKAVIGRTDTHGEIRGDEIYRWLCSDSNNLGVHQYIIIDDDRDMRPDQLHRFVHTSNFYGFTIKDYCKALCLFGVPDEQLSRQVNLVRPPLVIPTLT